jgi:hypothetical protein
MHCPEHQLLKKDEIYSWTAYNYLRHSKSMDREELLRRFDRASDASTAVRQHENGCPKCMMAQSA